MPATGAMKCTCNMDRNAFLLLASLCHVKKNENLILLHVMLALQGWFVCVVVSLQM